MIYKKNQIVTGKITKIDINNGLFVNLTDGTKGVVSPDHIGNIPENKINEYFSKFDFYKFKIISNHLEDEKLLYLSYKLCHPYLIVNKNKIIATSNNFKNLRKALLIDIDDYKKEHRNN